MTTAEKIDDLEEKKKELITRLGRYKELEQRLILLEDELKDLTLPKGKLVACYSDGTSPGTGLGKVLPEEIEHREKLSKKKDLDGAINILSDIDKVIIKLKYIEKVSGWHIYDVYIPNHFKDKYGQPLTMSKCTYLRKKDKALTQMLKFLREI